MASEKMRWKIRKKTPTVNYECLKYAFVSYITNKLPPSTRIISSFSSIFFHNNHMNGCILHTQCKHNIIACDEYLCV
ncbi:hypothetical protein DEO72_LG4g1398 [Vigna unguiculata]|uniref:Uncharacterized protein n=1 Tax=Vigna unguiculata TaxID=3917 RepID=A0A4D6LNI5_VIGUN|nr:hypothetical protein DEO72_LG4g1398 [Vigna unguiculata]